MEHLFVNWPELASFEEVLQIFRSPGPVLEHRHIFAAIKTLAYCIWIEKCPFLPSSLQC